MDYWASLTVPAGTLATGPVSQVVTVCPGVVKGVWLFFPKGHLGTTKVRIRRWGHQVWPTNLDSWYLGDGTVIEFGENYPLVGLPYEFVLEGYNTSTLYAHTVYVRFTVLPQERALLSFLPRPVALDVI